MLSSTSLRVSMLMRMSSADYLCLTLQLKSLSLVRLLLLDLLNSLLVTTAQIKSLTDRGLVLSQVRNLILNGHTAFLTDCDEMKPYRNHCSELIVQDVCLIWGARVVVPPPARKQLLEKLHMGHPGITRMKSLARSFVWWPTINKDLEEYVKSCDASQLSRHVPPSTPLHPWKWPKRSWSCFHIDYACLFLGHMFLVVDSHSKWLNVQKVSSATSTATITALHAIFACHGLPDMIVSENGSVLILLVRN